MANSKSAAKRVLIAERNRQRNGAYKASVRTAIKKVHSLLGANADEPKIQEAYQNAQSLIDRAVSKKLFKKNKGSRDKSRLQAAITRSAQA